MPYWTEFLSPSNDFEKLCRNLNCLRFCTKNTFFKTIKVRLNNFVGNFGENFYLDNIFSYIGENI